MEHILSKEEIEAVKALANINLEISEQKELLFKLQEEETRFLIKKHDRERIKTE